MEVVSKVRRNNTVQLVLLLWLFNFCHTQEQLFGKFLRTRNAQANTNDESDLDDGQYHPVDDDGQYHPEGDDGQYHPTGEGRYMHDNSGEYSSDYDRTDEGNLEPERRVSNNLRKETSKRYVLRQPSPVSLFGKVQSSSGHLNPSNVGFVTYPSGNQLVQQSRTQSVKLNPAFQKNLPRTEKLTFNNDRRGLGRSIEFSKSVNDATIPSVFGAKHTPVNYPNKSRTKVNFNPNRNFDNNQYNKNYNGNGGQHALDNSGRYFRNSNDGQYNGNVGQYEFDNSGRYTHRANKYGHVNEGEKIKANYDSNKYKAAQYKDDGRYNGDDGRYVPDDLGRYIHQDSKYVHIDVDGGKYTHQGDKYTHQADKHVDHFGRESFGSNVEKPGKTASYQQQNAGSVKDKHRNPKTLNKVPTISNINQNINKAPAVSNQNGNNNAQVLKQPSFGQEKEQPTTSRCSYDNLNNFKIIRQKGELNQDTYHHLFETENCMYAEERGEPKPDTKGMKAEGIFYYVGPDRIKYTVTYTADENGFIPHGEHIPTAPPIPEAIRRSLEYKKSVGELE